MLLGSQVILCCYFWQLVKNWHHWDKRSGAAYSIGVDYRKRLWSWESWERNIIWLTVPRSTALASRAIERQLDSTARTLSLFVTMDDRHRPIEVEPYEEIVDRAEVYSIRLVEIDRLVQCPSIGVSHLRSRYPKDPVLLYILYNANLMTSVMRPDPRYELALASQVPHSQTEHPDTSAVAVTGVCRKC